MNFDGTSWEKKIVKIFKAMTLMEKYKYLEPHFSKSFLDLAQFFSLSYKKGGGGQSISGMSQLSSFDNKMLSNFNSTHYNQSTHQVTKSIQKPNDQRNDEYEAETNQLRQSFNAPIQQVISTKFPKNNQINKNSQSNNIRITKNFSLDRSHLTTAPNNMVVTEENEEDDMLNELNLSQTRSHNAPAINRDIENMQQTSHDQGVPIPQQRSKTEERQRRQRIQINANSSQNVNQMNQTANDRFQRRNESQNYESQDQQSFTNSKYEKSKSELSQNKVQKQPYLKDLAEPSFQLNDFGFNQKAQKNYPQKVSISFEKEEIQFQQYIKC
eukprot:403344982